MPLAWLTQCFRRSAPHLHATSSYSRHTGWLLHVPMTCAISHLLGYLVPAFPWFRWTASRSRQCTLSENTGRGKWGKGAWYLQQAVCVRRKKKSEKKSTKNPAAPKTHHEIHSSPATTTTSRRHATKHVPCVSPYSPASIDPGFVEIGLVQLSQSVKTTNVTHTHIDRLL